MEHILSQHSVATDGQTWVGKSKSWLLCQGKPVARGDRKPGKGSDLSTGSGKVLQDVNRKRSSLDTASSPGHQTNP